MQNNGLLFAGIAALAIASWVIAFAVGPGLALYVVAIGLLVASVLPNAGQCTTRPDAAETVRS